MYSTVPQYPLATHRTIPPAIISIITVLLCHGSKEKVLYREWIFRNTSMKCMLAFCDLVDCWLSRGQVFIVCWPIDCLIVKMFMFYLVNWAGVICDVDVLSYRRVLWTWFAAYGCWLFSKHWDTFTRLLFVLHYAHCTLVVAVTAERSYEPWTCSCNSGAKLWTFVSRSCILM